MHILRIADWDEHYENSKSRSIKEMTWVPIPVKLDGDGYTELLDHENGPAHLGAWHAMIKVAAKCQPRGTLVREAGRNVVGPRQAHTSQTLSRVTRIPKELFDELIPRLLVIGWLEAVDEAGEVLKVDINGRILDPAERGLAAEEHVFTGSMNPEPLEGRTPKTTVNPNHVAAFQPQPEVPSSQPSPARHLADTSVTPGCRPGDTSVTPGCQDGDTEVPPHVRARNGREQNGMEGNGREHTAPAELAVPADSPPPKKRTEKRDDEEMAMDLAQLWNLRAGQNNLAHPNHPKIQINRDAECPARAASGIRARFKEFARLRRKETRGISTAELRAEFRKEVDDRIQRLMASDFHAGREPSSSGWRVSFGWLFEPGGWEKAGVLPSLAEVRKAKLATAPAFARQKTGVVNSGARIFRESRERREAARAAEADGQFREAT